MSDSRSLSQNSSISDKLTGTMISCVNARSERLELIMEKDLALCDCTACLLRLMSSSSGTPLRYRSRISSETMLEMKVSNNARCMHEIYNLSHISVQDLQDPSKIPDVYVVFSLS